MLALEAVRLPWGLTEAVDLRVDAGEVVGVVGPNGAGKSTLLRVAAGLFPPRAGAVRLEGRPLDGLSAQARAREVAFVAQDARLTPELTAREAVGLGRHPHRGRFSGATAADAEAVDAALADLELTPLSERPLDTLSGGERQRVRLALALAQAPRLLVLDEPTAHLDPGHGVALFERVVALAARRHLTVIAALHDLNLAALYCPRLWVLGEGRLLFDGPPALALTAERVGTVFSTTVRVVPHPDCGAPQVLPRAPTLGAS